MDEPLLAMLLPYLLKGLGPDVIADYRAATLMILTQLASKATLSAQLVSGGLTNRFVDLVWGWGQLRGHTQGCSCWAGSACRFYAE